MGIVSVSNWDMRPENESLASENLAGPDSGTPPVQPLVEIVTGSMRRKLSAGGDY